MVYLLLLWIVFATALIYLLVRRIAKLSARPAMRVVIPATVTHQDNAAEIKFHYHPRRRSSAARAGAALQSRDRRGRFSSRRRGADRDTIL